MVPESLDAASENAVVILQESKGVNTLEDGDYQPPRSLDRDISEQRKRGGGSALES